MTRVVTAVMANDGLVPYFGGCYARKVLNLLKAGGWGKMCGEKRGCGEKGFGDRLV